MSRIMVFETGLGSSWSEVRSVSHRNGCLDGYNVMLPGAELAMRLSYNRGPCRAHPCLRCH
jgi:hypothetical protein